ncbi:unnamed protein product, partial [Amoebophrya sp. A120]|eukprot:GSA120T00012596001.1
MPCPPGGGELQSKSHGVVLAPSGPPQVVVSTATASLEAFKKQTLDGYLSLVTCPEERRFLLQLICDYVRYGDQRLQFPGMQPVSLTK